ncbi:MAG: glucoamylase family protein [Methylotenera sp.]
MRVFRPHSIEERDSTLLRAELLSIEQLKRHAITLAKQHQIDPKIRPDKLLARLADNERVISNAYQAITSSSGNSNKANQKLSPAENWLLDNYYLIQQQFTLARRHLPRGYSRQLPKISDGASDGYPRIYDLALALISHTDGRVDNDNATEFIVAYQTVEPLMLGELWAFPIMLQLALLENLRRVSVRIANRRCEKETAIIWADRMLEAAENEPKQLIQLLARFADADIPLTAPFVEEFYARLQDQGAVMAFVQTWVEQQLLMQNITATRLLELASRTAAANQISIANSISSLRFIATKDWRDFVEEFSLVEQLLKHDPAGEYALQDFATRDRYRHVIEDIARLSARKELKQQVKQNNNHCAQYEMKAAHAVIDLATAACNELGMQHRQAHVGYYLIDEGLYLLRNTLNCHGTLLFKFKRICKPFCLGLYAGSILLLTVLLTAAVVVILNQLNVNTWFALVFGLLTLIATSGLAVALVNVCITQTFHPHCLPRLDFSKGIPEPHRTVVVVPTLIGSTDEIDHLLEVLEVRYLGNQDPNLFFALLTDFRDAAQRVMLEDAGLIAHARSGIEALNVAYQADRPCIFYLFHRQREWNNVDRIWMGYERKRGKLEQFNTLLRAGDMESVSQTAFTDIVGDQKLLRTFKYVITLDTDTQLPRDSAKQLIGNMAHSLNKPIFDLAIGRVTHGYAILQPRTSISLVSASQTYFTKLYAGEAGIDPYTREISDVYQDVFAEGSFVGKGIYDIDAFRQAVDRRFPNNLILSHDLLESGYARSALVTDVDLIEEHPASYTMDISRRHRWIRGDWQLLSWLLPRVPSVAGKLVNPLSALFKWKMLDNLRRSLVPIILTLLLITSWVIVDGNGEANTAWLALATVLLILYWPPILGVLINAFKKPKESTWLVHAASACQSSGNVLLLATLQLVFLPYEAAVNIDAIINSAGRLLFTKRGLLQWYLPIYARRNICKSLFDFYAEMWIAPVIAFTLIIFLVGIQLLSSNLLMVWVLCSPVLILWLASPAVAWFISRPIISKHVALMPSQIEFLHSHAKLTWDYFAQFVCAEDNWLPPDNVQVYPTETVASRTSPTNMGLGLLANLAAYDFDYINLAELLSLTENTLASMEKLARYHGHFYNWYDTRTLQVLNPQYISSVDSGNLLGCLITLQAGLAEVKDDSNVQKVDDLFERIGKLAEMDFKFLYDDKTDLLSIGFDVGERRRDPSCYDLLASEARLASFILIANGQLPQKHWFSLGRLLTKTSGETSLISWSGSMFEYLMPQLLMPNFDNTLLDQTCKAVVKQQIKYGQQQNVPWGISESCYNVTDIAQVYQYRAFGVPGLGFKRGLADDLVIAPYATALALMIMPNEACNNLQVLADSGFVGQYGFYEAIDYTPNRLPRGKKHAVVQTFMAHHQGMSLLAFSHVLLNKPMQRRFMATPYIRATELLLQERIPKLGSTLEPNVAKSNANIVNDDDAVGLMRVFTSHNTQIPEVHLLSNGRYHVMVTNAGGGYSHWHDLNVTRWREDATLDNWGSFIYLRDMDSQRLWSAAHQPTLRQADHYEAVFTQARAEYRRRDQAIETHTEISVSPEDDVEIRRVTLTNLSNRARNIEITSYAEVVLAPQNADLAHRAFSNLFVQTEILHDRQAIIFTRRPRTKDERVSWMFHLIAEPGMDSEPPSYETDRAKFIGRGRTAANPVAFDATESDVKPDSNLFGQVSSQITGQLFGKQSTKSKNQPLSNTDGSVLDPIAAIRRTVKLATDRATTLQIITGIASSREAAIALIDKYGDKHFVERAFEMAWFQSQEVLRMLNVTESDAQVFGRLASSVIYCNALRRAAPSVIARNNLGQSGLWRFGISGDLPIVLIRIADVGRINLVKQLLQAHTYWRMNGLIVDLVIINEDFSGYRAALQDSIIGLINAGPEAQAIDKPGGVFIRRGDELSEEARVLFQAVARIVFTDSEETLIEQVERRVAIDRATERAPDRLEPMFEIEQYPLNKLPERNLIFSNGIGGFTTDGHEYVITLKNDQITPASLTSMPMTPMPWCNVIASPHIGTVVSESGSAYTWVENAHEFRLSAWHNDPIADTSGEAHYIRDDETGAFWSPTALPNCNLAQENSDYLCRHGFGYSVFEHQEFGISSELTTYVAMDAPVKFVVIKLKNISKRTRKLSVLGYCELVMGEWRHANMMQIVTEHDAHTGAILAKNAYGRECANRIVFAHVSEKDNSFTGSRTEFIGRNSSLSSPAAMRRKRLSGKVGAGLDPCIGLQAQITLLENQERELVFIFGAAKNIDEIQGYVQKMGGVAGARQTLDSVHEYWNHTLGAVQVETPDAALNVLTNGWLLYQTISCRLWGRSGYYQSGGAYGFRDQLQDTMALVHATPWLAREQIIRCAERQFSQGDVQHWWHPPNGQGVRTHFSDDYLWLAYATCRYVLSTGDTAILDEQIHFLEGRPLNPVEEAYYDLPQRSNDSASLYDHCVRAIKNGLRFGIHQLPLMGCGDWNDGMNLVGKDGKGESVWLAWFLLDNLISFSKIANMMGDFGFAENCTTQAALLKGNIETNAWDGEWYRRAYFDDGTPLGSKENDECQIDSISQSWAVISKSGDPIRASQAMQSVNNRLVQREAQFIKLLDPPFDQSNLEPGYIKGYVPGVRENGGQYTHAAIWATMAFAMKGDNERAWELFDMLNPINHAKTSEQVNTYKVEPYVMSADIYAVTPHVGRGGWTWYTGAAGWMYRLTLETLLGITLEGNQLRINPCVPAHWENYKIHYRFRDTVYHITINCNRQQTATTEKLIYLENDAIEHFVEI